MAGGQLDAVTAKVIDEAYRQKDPLAEEIMEQAQKALISGFASLINLYNPCRLILGGGLMDGLPEMISMIEKGIRETALKAATQSLEIMPARLGKEVGVIGSAAAIFNLVKR